MGGERSVLSGGRAIVVITVLRGDVERAAARRGEAGRGGITSGEEGGCGYGCIVACVAISIGVVGKTSAAVEEKARGAGGRMLLHFALGLEIILLWPGAIADN